MSTTLIVQEREYTVIIEKAASGANWGAYSPDVSGCYAVGDTVEETLDLFAGALTQHFDVLRQEGLPIPSPVTMVRSG